MPIFSSSSKENSVLSDDDMLPDMMIIDAERLSSSVLESLTLEHMPIESSTMVQGVFQAQDERIGLPQHFSKLESLAMTLSAEDKEKFDELYAEYLKIAANQYCTYNNIIEDKNQDFVLNQLAQDREREAADYRDAPALVFVDNPLYSVIQSEVFFTDAVRALSFI